MAGDAFAVEGDSTGNFVFSRDGSLSAPLSIAYSVSGSATVGTDYLTLAGSITIPAGMSSISVPVVPVKDALSESTESVTVTLNAVAGYSTDLGAATVSIRDWFDQAQVAALVPLSETFALHSLPGARHTLYLDFDGGTVNDSFWSSSTINVNPFSLEGTSAFSDAELATIQRIWEVVAEDYRPFGLDVTTELPNIEKLRKTSTSDTEWGLRVMIGDPIEYSANATGRAQTGSFSANYDAVAWVDLSDSSWGNLSNKSARTIGGLISHEAGHAMNLDHDGSSSTSYYSGHGTQEARWAPIMGSVFSGWNTGWSKGDYPGANEPEDDLAILATTNGFTYRFDDHADSASHATPLSSVDTDRRVAEGVIERTTDFDWFSFNSSGGLTRISVEPHSLNPNVDLQAELYDSALNLIATSAPTNQLAAGFNETLTTGTYFLRVTGTGNLTWSTGGYDDYASLGAYVVAIGGDSDLAAYFPAPGQNSTPMVGTATLNDVTHSTLTVVGASSGSDSSAIWPVYWPASSTQNLNNYLKFTLTPTSTRRLDLDQLQVGLQGYATTSSSSVALRSSLDGFAANIDGTRTFGASNFADLSFNLRGVADSTSPVEFRLYVWGSATGFRSVRNLVIEGRTIADGPVTPAAPIANNDIAATTVNTPVAISVLSNDSDANGDPLNIAAITTQPAHGTVTANANGTLTYSPTSGYLGSDSFSYTATDGTLTSNVATVTLTIVAVNNVPVANNDSATTAEDTSTTINVLSNDTDADNDPLTVSILSNPARGTATVNANGTISYTPAANDNGSDSFTYRVSDGTAASNTATVSLNISAVNDAPVATNDSATTTQNTAVTINVLSNDSDVEGSTLMPNLVAVPAHGSVTVNANGTITYSPLTGYVGTDSLTYSVSDGSATSNTATVSLNVVAQSLTLASYDPVGSQGSANLAGTTGLTGVTVSSLNRVGASSGTNTNLWPVYWTGSTTINPTQYLTFSVTAASTSLADFSKLTVSFYEWVNGTSNAAVRSSLDGFTANIGGVQTITDTGNADVVFDLASLPMAAGTVTFRIYVFDSVDGTTGWRDIRSSAASNGKGVLLEGTTLANAAPIASDDVASTNEDTAVTISVLSNDSDADGNSLTPTLLTQPTHGTATVNPNGTISYTPAANNNGSDSFTYRVSDGGLNSNTATVSISIAAVNDAPTAIDNAFSTMFQTLLDVPAASGVLANDSDVDGDSLTVSPVSSPTHGTLTLNANGSFQYAPAPGYVGTDSFSYTVSDGLASSQATVTITVTPPPDDHSNLLNSTATSLALSSGTRGTGAASGVFEIAGDRDVFKVTLATGQLTAMLNGVSGLSTVLRVFNASGAQIATVGPNVSNSVTLNVTAGTYYLSAGSNNDALTGSFTLSVTHREKRSTTWQQGVNGYTGTTDTHVSGSYATSNFATWNMNQIDYTSATLQEQSLLQFKNLFGSGTNQVPFGSEIASATLTIYITNSGNRFNLHRMLSSWTDTATWNSLTLGIQANGIEAVATPDSQTGTNVPTGWQSIDVKSSIIAWLANPNQNFGWALMPTGTDGVDWYTSNNSVTWVPRLSIDYYIPNGDQHANAPISAATALPISNNTATAFGTLETAGDRDAFQFTLTQTRTVTINLALFGTGTLNTYLRLYDSAGTVLGENNDSNSTTNSKVVITLSAGTYYVSAGSNLDTGIGDYWLELLMS